MTSSTPRTESDGAHVAQPEPVDASGVDDRASESADAPSDGTADGSADGSTGAVPTGPRPQSRSGMRGNWRSLLLSMVAVAAVVLVLFSVVPRPDAVVQPPVDVTPVARQLHDESKVTVWIPQLGEPGRPWKATSVRHETSPVVTWYAGYQRTDDDSVFVAVQQTPVSTEAKAKEDWLGKAVAQGRPDGAGSVAGATWTRYATGGDRPRRGLVGELGGMTTVVSGLADYATLEHVAASLRPYSG